MGTSKAWTRFLAALWIAAGCAEDGGRAVPCASTRDCTGEQVCLDGACTLVGASQPGDSGSAAPGDAPADDEAPDAAVDAAPDSAEDAPIDAAVDDAPTDAAGDDATSYAYSAWGSFGSCSTTCGAGSKHRSRTCRTLDGAVVSCLLCGGDCGDSTSCTSYDGCTYAYGSWSAWGDCVNIGAGGEHSRTRSCVRSDGAGVAALQDGTRRSTPRPMLSVCPITHWARMVLLEAAKRSNKDKRFRALHIPSA